MKKQASGHHNQTRYIDMKDSVEWRQDIALSNKTVNEVMDKFFDELIKGRVDLPIGTDIFVTESKLKTEKSNEDDNT